MNIEETALNVIRAQPDGVFQNQLWKMLDIDSRKCSRVISKLLVDELIVREQAVSNGARTFLLKVKEGKRPTFELLMAGEVFSPCAGCRDACQPENCEKLTYWVMHLKNDEVKAEIA